MTRDLYMHASHGAAKPKRTPLRSDRCGRRQQLLKPLRTIPPSPALAKLHNPGPYVRWGGFDDTCLVVDHRCCGRVVPPEHESDQKRAQDGKGGAPKCFHGCVDHGVDLITRILFYQPGYTSYWDFDESEPKQLPIYFQKRKRLACYQNHPSSFNLAVTAAAATAHLNHHTVPAAVASVLLGRTDGPARPSLDDVGCSACCCCICISY
ncbi:hypothetical protein KC323_g105 [Hortaea werneckii]|nr:hypothetical protein KC323_g105 [Hortaea werneckii]